LTATEKVHWLIQLEDKVIAKGKGEVEKYWLNINQTWAPETQAEVPPLRDNDGDRPLEPPPPPPECRPEIDSGHDTPSNKSGRVFDWNVELLLRALKQISARRVTNRRSSASCGGGGTES
jgi:hypothetical protein